MLHFSIQNRLQDRRGKVSEAAGARWRFYRRIILESSFSWRKHFREFRLKSFTMPGATPITLQLYQILRLPRKMKLMIDPPHIWNIIYNARSNSYHPPTLPNMPRKMNVMIDPRHIRNVISNARSNKSHPPTSPSTAPATQNECHDWSASHTKPLQTHQVQRLPRNLQTQDFVSKS